MLIGNSHSVPFKPLVTRLVAKARPLLVTWVICSAARPSP